MLRFESEERAKTPYLLSVKPALFMMEITEEGTLISISPHGQELTGYDREDISRSFHISNLLEMLDCGEVLPCFKNGSLAGYTDGNEFVLVCKNGTRLPVHAYFEELTQVHDTSTSHYVIVQCFPDCFIDRQTRNALRESEEKFSIAFHTNPSMMIITTMDDPRYLEVNESYCRGTGYTREELVGHHVADFSMWADEIEMNNMVTALQEKGQISGAEYHFITRTGDIKTWLCSSHIITFNGERCVLGVANDITERKEAEAELELMYETETGLREQLEEEMKRRAEFTRALVHELKTPLTPIAASSEVLAMILNGEPMRSMAENINRGAHNLNKRIDELLELARSELNVLRIDPSNIDIRPLLKQVHAEMLSVAVTRDQKLNLVIPDYIGIVHADSGRIRQVMENLLTNALKYTPQGGEITIRAAVEDQNVTIQISDNGPGLTESEADRVFQPYYRKERDRDHLSGLGLGLALCKTLIDLHGGSIWVETEPGKGSTFSFSLPLVAH